MMYKLFKIKALPLFLCLFYSSIAFTQADSEVGKTLFRNNCATCHNRNMIDNLTGPALGGVEERWSDYPQEDLYAWIRSSATMISDGHPRAVELWNEWKPTSMNPFPNLTDDDIASLLLYINDVYTGVGATVAGGGAGQGAVAEEGKSNKTLYYILFGFLALLALVLARVIARLRYLADVKDGLVGQEPRTIWQMLTSKGAIAIIILALVVLGGYTTINNAVGLNRQQDYQPDQPIKFSHVTHAGINQIDCQYCHDGARRSKHSVIPATNTCMNCHKAIKKGTLYGTQEISKIFASIGFNPNTDTYIEDYENYTEKQIEDVFTTWIANEYIKDVGTFDAKGERTVTDQWDDIKTALTNENKPQIQGPIEWIRIHNVPDHVFFSHAQHVTAGEIECQQCHGPVEEMEVVKQYAPLSMGWCINCHRQTEVQFTNNPYYESYEKYHEEIKMGERTGVTVEEIGGIECQKCHY